MNFTVHDPNSGNLAPHRCNIINPESGEILSFLNWQDVGQYCKRNKLIQHRIQIGHRFTNNLSHLNLQRIEIVKDDLLTYEDLKNYAAAKLWGNTSGFHERPYKKFYNTLKKRPDRDKFLKFILYTYGKRDFIFILKERLDRHGIDPDIKGLWREIKSGIEKICGFKLTYPKFREVLSNPSSSKVKSLNQKLAIYGYLKRWYARNFPFDPNMPVPKHVSECVELIQDYMKKMPKKLKLKKVRMRLKDGDSGIACFAMLSMTYDKALEFFNEKVFSEPKEIPKVTANEMKKALNLKGVKYDYLKNVDSWPEHKGYAVLNLIYGNQSPYHWVIYLPKENVILDPDPKKPGKRTDFEKYRLRKRPYFSLKP